MNAHVHTVASGGKRNHIKIMIIHRTLTIIIIRSKSDLLTENKGIFKFTQRKWRKLRQSILNP